jgi:hypothetical protein
MGVSYLSGGQDALKGEENNCTGNSSMSTNSTNATNKHGVAATLRQIISLGSFETVGPSNKVSFFQELAAFICQPTAPETSTGPRPYLVVGKHENATVDIDRQIIDATDLCRSFFDARISRDSREAYDLRELARERFQSLSDIDAKNLREYLVVISDLLLGLKAWDDKTREDAQVEFADVCEQYGLLFVHPKDSVIHLWKTHHLEKLRPTTHQLISSGKFFRNVPYRSGHPIVVATMRKSGTIYVAETLEAMLGTSFFSPRLLPEAENLLFETLERRQHIVFDHYTPNRRFLGFLENSNIRRLLVHIRHPIEAAYSDYFYRRGHRVALDLTGKSYTPLALESVADFSLDSFFSLIASNVSFIEAWKEFAASSNTDVHVKISEFRTLVESPRKYFSDLLGFFECRAAEFEAPPPQVGKSNFTGYDSDRWKSNLPSSIVNEAMTRVPSEISAMFDKRQA